MSNTYEQIAGVEVPELFGLTVDEIRKVHEHWECHPASLEQTRITIKLGKLREAVRARATERASKGDRLVVPLNLSVADVIELAAILNMRISEVSREGQRCREVAAQLRALKVKDNSPDAMDVMAARYDAEIVNVRRLLGAVENA